MARSKPSRIEGQFVAHRIEMLASLAWSLLNNPERQVLDRLEIEHMAHAGKENGALPCTYDDFEGYGVRRKSIAPAIEKLVELGFVEVTERGRGGNAAWRRSARYRLTYLPTPGSRPNHFREATDEWRKCPVPAKAGLAAGVRTESAQP